MTSGLSNRGKYVPAMQDFATTPGCNFGLNQRFAAPTPNIQGYPVNMQNVIFYPNYPMYQNLQIPSHLVQNTSNYRQLPTMPIPRIPIWQVGFDELATWVRDFACFKRWPEAEKYANSFRTKRIDGEKIIGMDSDQLQVQLQITKLGHRLEILRAVRELRSIRNHRAVAMERYGRSYSDTEKSELSSWCTDHLPRSGQEPQRRSGRKVSGSIRRHGRQGNKKVLSDVGRKIFSKPSPRSCNRSPRSCNRGTVTPN